MQDQRSPGRVRVFLDLVCGDLDGRADHVGRSLLSFGAFRRLMIIPPGLRGAHRSTKGESRCDAYSDTESNPQCEFARGRANGGAKRRTERHS